MFGTHAVSASAADTGTSPAPEAGTTGWGHPHSQSDSICWYQIHSHMTLSSWHFILITHIHTAQIVRLQRERAKKRFNRKIGFNKTTVVIRCWAQSDKCTGYPLLHRTGPFHTLFCPFFLCSSRSPAPAHSFIIVHRSTDPFPTFWTLKFASLSVAKSQFACSSLRASLFLVFVSCLASQVCVSVFCLWLPIFLGIPFDKTFDQIILLK